MDGLRQVPPRDVSAETVMTGEPVQGLGIMTGRSVGPRLHGSFAQRQSFVVDDTFGIEHTPHPQPVAFGAGPVRIMKENSRGSISSMVNPD
jgi:hypothetical protein